MKRKPTSIYAHIHRLYIFTIDTFNSRKRPLSVLFTILMIYFINSVLSYALVVQNLPKNMSSVDVAINLSQIVLLFMSFYFWFLMRRKEYLATDNEEVNKRYRKIRFAARNVMMISTGILTLKLSLSIAALVSMLPVDLKRKDADILLLWDAYIVWSANVLVFATWYWLLDLGDKYHFCFPLQEKHEIKQWEGDWEPNLIDYWFLAFTTSTAFSPTDTKFLSRWSKVLLIIQSSLSLIVLTVLAARAVNILKFAPPVSN